MDRVSRRCPISLAAGPSHLQVQFQLRLFPIILKRYPLCCGEGRGKGEHPCRAGDGNKNREAGQPGEGRGPRCLALATGLDGGDATPGMPPHWGGCQEPACG